MISSITIKPVKASHATFWLYIESHPKALKTEVIHFFMGFAYEFYYYMYFTIKAMVVHEVGLNLSILYPICLIVKQDAKLMITKV